MKWEIPIDGWRPAVVNELLGCHYMKAARLKKLDRDHVILFSRLHGRRIPPPMGKRRVSLRITLPKGQRRWDVDALLKSTLDACKHAQLIIDDNEDHAEWGGVEYLRNRQARECSTVVIVEDFNPGEEK